MPESLPLVLAGPIVRRVEPTACSFWVALSEPADVTAALWFGPRMAGDAPGTVDPGDAPLATSSPVRLRRYADHLHVGVVTVRLDQDGGSGLVPASLYAYDVVFSGAFGERGLRQEGLLRDEADDARLPGAHPVAPLHLALGYDENRLPSFLSPVAEPEELRVAHASCRKPHGPKDDALAWLDERIRDAAVGGSDRPQQLFLTGDQIYADDVAASLLPTLNALGRDLLGSRREELPVDGQRFEGTIENFPPLRRAKLVRGAAAMSSTACASHLLTFAEYAAMYLAVWSPRVWRALATDDEVFTAPPASVTLREHLTDIEACHGGGTDARAHWREKRSGAVDEARKQVAAFRDEVPKVARVLANVATYMIFDDHEVTDDWNLNARWRRRVYTQPLGRAIVRNGVMAYGVFQGWGNDPEAFAKVDSPNALLLAETSRVLGADARPSQPLPVGDTILLDRLAGMHEGDEDEQDGRDEEGEDGEQNERDAQKKRATWHYSVPGLCHLVAVLDTRTRRTFEGNGLAPPDLLGATLEDQVPTGPLTGGRLLLFLVAPAPVLGPEVIDRLGATAYELIGDASYGWKKLVGEPDPCDPGDPNIGAEVADAEGWSANERARERLFGRLAGHDSVVILSGDVHYGCSLRLDYWKGDAVSSMPIVQLTSSPSHNVFETLVETLVRKNALLQRYAEGRNPELLAWDDPDPLVLPAGAKVSLGRRARLRREPVLVPARGWPEGSAVRDGREPAWRWRLDLLADTRSNEQLPDAAPRPPRLIENDLVEDDASTHLATYRRVAAAHQMAALQDALVQMRRIVFEPNVGLVDVFNADGGLAVRHTLLSRSVSPPFRGVASTVHQTPLAPSAAPAPTLVTEG